MENNQQKVHHLSLYVTGVKKRCRKVDRHSFDMGDVAPGHWTDAQIIEEAKKYIEKEMKSVTKASVGVTPTTISHENGFVVRSFSLCLGGAVFIQVPVA